MSLTECPHCYARVSLTADGICPSCRKSPEAPGADPSKTRITIYEGRVLAPVCLGCGNHTDSTLKFCQATSSGIASFVQGVFKLIFVFLRILILGIFSLFMDPSNKMRPRIRLRFRIPWCLRCKGQSSPEIVWTDFEKDSISMVVTKTVRDRIAPPN